MSTAAMFIADEKLPDDVLRKEYSPSIHALCCLDCGFESTFNPNTREAIGPPLMALLYHDCPEDND